MAIDWTINFGHVLTLGTLAFGLIAGAMAMKSQGDATAIRLASVEKEMRAMTTVLVQIARQDERLNAHGERLTHIEHRVQTIEARAPA